MSQIIEQLLKLNDLEGLRKGIDTVDDAVLFLLSKRFEFAKKVGLIKKQKKLAMVQKDREKQMFEHHKSISAKLGLDYSFVQELFSVILKKSKEVQEKEMKK